MAHPFSTHRVRREYIAKSLRSPDLPVPVSHSADDAGHRLRAICFDLLGHPNKAVHHNLPFAHLSRSVHCKELL